MRIIKPYFEIIAATEGLEEVIELAGRVCYKSEDKIEPGSAEKFVSKIRSLNHESVLEHGSITVKLVCDRGVTHEAVRHRIASFSQESTRYCNYSKDKFDNQITVIEPVFFDREEPLRVIPIPRFGLADHGDGNLPILFEGDEQNPPLLAEMNSFDVWLLTCLWTEWGYNTLVTEFKRTAQEARSVLPNSLKTEIMVTANPREWRHILKLRAGTAAHPQMRELMVPLQEVFQKRWPSIFID